MVAVSTCRPGANVIVDQAHVNYNRANGFGVTGGFGGGIFFDDTAGSLTVENNSTVDGNTSEFDGGGIFNDQNTLTIEGSSVSSNTAGVDIQTGNLVPGGVAQGGGIYNLDGTLTLTNFTGTSMTYLTHVDGNDVFGDGGGIYNTSGGTVNVTNLSTVGQYLDGNRAQYDGGGIFNDGGTVNVNTGGKVNGNAAGSNLSGLPSGPTATVFFGSGGGIYNRASGDVTVDGAGVAAGTTQVNNNTAYRGTAPYEGNGGGIFNDGTGFSVDATTVDIINTASVNDNRAQADGGGIYNKIGTLYVGGSSTVNGNDAGWTAGGDGGGIFNAVDGVVLIDQSSVDNNTARYSSGLNYGGHGGGIFQSKYAGNLKIQNFSSVDGNLAVYGYGGGIFIANNNLVDIEASSVSNNESYYHGGGIFNWGGRVDVYADASNNASHIDNNTAGYYDFVYGDPTLSDLYGGDGGGIFNTAGLDAIGGVVTVTDSTINCNNAIYDGTQGGNGGGIFNELGSSVTLTNAEVHYNEANRHGGGIYNVDDGSIINIVGAGTSINWNIAGQSFGYVIGGPGPSLYDLGGNGGGIFNTGGADIVLPAGNAINYNIALSAGMAAMGNGGGIFNTGTGSTITATGTTGSNVQINNNKADRNGGGLYNTADATSSLTYTQVQNNVAGADSVAMISITPSTRWCAALRARQLALA